MKTIDIQKVFDTVKEKFNNVSIVTIDYGTKKVKLGNIWFDIAYDTTHDSWYLQNRNATIIDKHIPVSLKFENGWIYVNIHGFVVSKKYLKVLAHL